MRTKKDKRLELKEETKRGEEREAERERTLNMFSVQPWQTEMMNTVY